MTDSGKNQGWTYSETLVFHLYGFLQEVIGHTDAV